MRLVDCFCDLFAYTLNLAEHQEQDLDAQQVQENFLKRIEESRQCAQERDYNQQQFEEALFAVAVWVDEIILCSNLPLVTSWPSYQLQLHFFGINNGGDQFYDHLDAVDRQDTELLEIFAYCLAFGFHGRLYGDTAALEERRAELNSRLHNESAPSDKLFPASYRSNTGKKGYKAPRIYALRTLVFFLLPLSFLIGIYFILFYRLDIHMQSVLGG